MIICQFCKIYIYIRNCTLHFKILEIVIINWIKIKMCVIIRIYKYFAIDGCFVELI